MSLDPPEKPAVSPAVKLLRHPLRPWVAVGVGLLLILAPVGAAYLDEVLVELLSSGNWRYLFLPPTVILYILLVSPVLRRAEARVLEAFRPVVLLDDDSFKHLVDRASRLNPTVEVISFVAGAAFGFWLGHFWLTDANVFWLKLYLPLSLGLMFGLLGWIIYAAVASTRLTAELHRQPLHIDIFDTRPFEPIGRQSLSLALAFIGGIVLSMLFGLGTESILAWQNWLLYLLLMLVSVLVFFLNMRDTHRVLMAEKNRELVAVRRNILQACRTLMQYTDAGERSGSLAPEIIALVAYEERLKGTSTWPYDTAQLRTLLFSVIIPGGAALARAASDILFE